MGEGPVKRSYVDGAPLGHWTEIITVARGYGYTGQALSSDATRYLNEHGHTVEERDITEPKGKIDDTYAYCPQHPTVRYDYTRYDHCLYCEKQSKRRKRFFALCRELGYGADFAKERAKAHFAVASFNDLTIEQLNWLIDRLEQQQARRGSAQPPGSRDREHREPRSATSPPPGAMRE
jgi:hypothetical protein